MFSQYENLNGSFELQATYPNFSDFIDISQGAKIGQRVEIMASAGFVPWTVASELLNGHASSLVRLEITWYFFEDGITDQFFGMSSVF